MNISVADAVAIGALIAALAGYLLNAWIDRRTRAGVQRTEAYLDFIRSQLAMAHIADPNDTEFRRMDLLNLDARARILLYGSAKVVEKLCDLKSMPRSISNISTLRAFSDVFAAMRKDSIGDDLARESTARILVLAQGEQMSDEMRRAFE